jgi:hypothetical protein
LPPRTADENDDHRPDNQGERHEQHELGKPGKSELVAISHEWFGEHATANGHD